MTNKNLPAGSSGTPTLQSTVTATVTLTNVPSTAVPDATWADVLASDVTSYVGGAQVDAMRHTHHLLN